MKTPLKSILGAATVLAVALVGIAAISPAAKPLVPYEREQTKGDIRVVLLKVERATFFVTNGIRNPLPGKFYPVPMVGVTYLVEALGDEPIKNWKDDQSYDGVMIGNRKVNDDASMPENLIGGLFVISYPISRYGAEPIKLPKAAKDERRSVEEQYFRAVPLKSGTMQIKIKAGINDKTETFVFDNIPLN